MLRPELFKTYWTSMLKTKGAAESGVESWIVFVLYSTIYHHLSNANPRLIPLGCLIGGHHLSRFFYINLSLFGGTSLIHQPGFVNPMVMDSTDEKLIIPT
jgi:hypothetical protein